MGFFDFFKQGTQNEEEIKYNNLVSRANLGDADAMFELGDFYEQNSNYQEAEKWFLKAIEKGHPMAKYYLALNYSAGMGGPKMMETAVRYLTELVEDGYEAYTKDLGYIFSNFRNKRHPLLRLFYDLKKAEMYYLRAVQVKNQNRWAAAVHELGVLYAGSYLYTYNDNDIQNPIKAAYCLYMASVEGEYDKGDFFTVVNNAGLTISNEQYNAWLQDFKNRNFSM